MNITKDNPFKCEFCPQIFKYSKSYKNHTIINHPNNCVDHSLVKFCQCIKKVINNAKTK